VSPLRDHLAPVDYQFHYLFDDYMAPVDYLFRHLFEDTWHLSTTCSITCLMTT
jgi:hypothetical protein